MATLSSTAKAKLKNRILLDVSLWFAANCSDSMDEDARKAFLKLFDKSIGAAIDLGTLTSYNKKSRDYLRKKTQKLARSVCCQTTGKISAKLLEAIADEFLTGEKVRALKLLARVRDRQARATRAKRAGFKRRGDQLKLKTVFCDQYS
jgi:hypothetical protein